jgi:hypothetical protein
MLCSLLDKYKDIRGTYYLHLQGRRVMEEVGSCETLVPTYRTIWHHFPGDQSTRSPLCVAYLIVIVHIE